MATLNKTEIFFLKKKKAHPLSETDQKHMVH